MRHGAIPAIYRAWSSMRNRCLRPGNPDYFRYGKRGITICSEWDNYITFEIWALKNGWKSGLYLDRKDNDKEYSPDNCRWTTAKESSTNRRSTRFIEAFGERKSMMEWSEDARCQVDYATFRHRLIRGWPTERALSTPTLNSRKP